MAASGLHHGAGAFDVYRNYRHEQGCAMDMGIFLA